MNEMEASAQSPVPGGSSDAVASLELSPAELQLVRTALEMLEDTLGREEADELAEVQSLLGRLDRSGPG